MKNLRTQFERFCYKNRNKGIQNLMLYIALGTAVVYFMSEMAGNYTLYYLLCFDRARILQGEVWRLITYPLTYGAGNSNLFLIAISLFCYYSLGRAIEYSWGTFRFNLFYFSGIVLMDVYCLIFGGYASVTYLNLSLFLSYATMYPDAHFLLFFIIPIKAWFFGLFDLAIVLFDLFTLSFPTNLFSVISIANYLLFFGKDVVNLLPASWRTKVRHSFRKSGPNHRSTGPKVIQFRPVDSDKASPVRETYTHRCTVCGKTDVSHPDLEFRYCSRCNGYYCYCEEHISNHTHIQ